MLEAKFKVDDTITNGKETYKILGIVKDVYGYSYILEYSSNGGCTRRLDVRDQDHWEVCK